MCIGIKQMTNEKTNKRTNRSTENQTNKFRSQNNGLPSKKLKLLCYFTFAIYKMCLTQKLRVHFF